jgi:hypothetical protein
MSDEEQVRAFNKDMSGVLDHLREAEGFMAWRLKYQEPPPLPSWAPKMLEEWIVAISGIREDIETRLGLPEGE